MGDESPSCPTDLRCSYRLPAAPPAERAEFRAIYARLENAYSQLISRMIGRSGQMCAVALVVVAMAIFGLTRIPTGFLPIEDQGYVRVSVQLPDGASLSRTNGVLGKVTEIARKTPGVDQVIAISGVSALDNNSTLANAGVAYVVLKDWSKPGKGEDFRSLLENLNRDLGTVKDARILALLKNRHGRLHKVRQGTCAAQICRCMT